MLNDIIRYIILYVYFSKDVKFVDTHKKSVISERKTGLNDIVSSYNLITTDNDSKSVDSLMRRCKGTIYELLAKELIRKQ